MKLILASVTLVFALGLTVQGAIDPEVIKKLKDDVHKIGMDCLSEISITDEEIERMLAKQLPETHDGKCVVACVFRKMKFIDENNKPDLKVARASVEFMKEMDKDLHAKMVAVIDKCETAVTVDADVCETAYGYLDCTRKTAKELGIDDSFIQ